MKASQQNKNRLCLRCYKPVVDTDTEYHAACCKQLFQSSKPPQLDIALSDIDKLAKMEANLRITIPGVQPKLSLELKREARNSRLTLVNVMGNYILKPPFADFPELPEIEHLTMQMARACEIETAENGLVRLRSGELAYIAKRFDRINDQKLAVEDFCQITGSLTEHKYNGSLEKVGKALKMYSSNPGIDAARFFELVVFCFLVGNADMHLKNFSLVVDLEGEVSLSPAYDLVATKLVLPEDQEESALTLNGKKRKLVLNDFLRLAENLEIEARAVKAILQRLLAKIPELKKLIGQSFVGTKTKMAFLELMDTKAQIFMRSN